MLRRHSHDRGLEDLRQLFHEWEHWSADLDHLRAILAEGGLKFREGSTVDQKLSELRRMYEPYVYSLSNYLRIIIPPWIPKSRRIDNWQTSAWERSTGFQIDGLGELDHDEHF